MIYYSRLMLGRVYHLTADPGWHAATFCGKQAQFPGTTSNHYASGQPLPLCRRCVARAEGPLAVKSAPLALGAGR